MMLTEQTPHGPGKSEVIVLTDEEPRRRVMDSWNTETESKSLTFETERNTREHLTLACKGESGS